MYIRLWYLNRSIWLISTKGQGENDPGIDGNKDAPQPPRSPELKPSYQIQFIFIV